MFITAVLFALGFGYMVGREQGKKWAYKQTFKLASALGDEPSS